MTNLQIIQAAYEAFNDLAHEVASNALREIGGYREGRSKTKFISGCLAALSGETCPDTKPGKAGYDAGKAFAATSDEAANLYAEATRLDAEMAIAA